MAIWGGRVTSTTSWLTWQPNSNSRENNAKKVLRGFMVLTPESGDLIKTDVIIS
jgi:hypothetical protein